MTTPREEAMFNLKYLKSSVGHLQHKPIYELCDVVLSNDWFMHAPGGSEHHHNYRHGLVKHVSEVMHNVFKLTAGWTSPGLIVSVIWHDYMKTLDYEFNSDESVKKMPYRKLINHVSGSFAEFYLHARRLKLADKFIEDVGHCLLSHHGRKEWGSPVEPLTADAFILHAADMMSAHGIVL